MCSVQQIKNFITPRLGGEIVIQQLRKNYIVVNTCLLNRKVLKCYENLVESFAVDVVFSNDDNCYISENCNYRYPSRILTNIAKVSIRKQIKKCDIPNNSKEMVQRCVEAICEFDSTHFIPVINVKENLSWTELSLSIYELHVVDLQYLMSKMEGSIIDISFKSGKLNIKLRRNALKRAKNDEKKNYVVETQVEKAKIF